MYAERPAAVRGAVLWTSGVDRDEVHRVLPDGCMDVIWGERGGEGWLQAAGTDTTAMLAASRAGTRYVALRFAPGDGPAVLGVPADALRDRRVPLEDLWPAAEVRELNERLASSGKPGRLLEEYVRRRGGEPDLLARPVTAGLQAGRSVAAVADEVGLSERQLHRRSLAVFGYGPKMLARIFRLGRALEWARAGIPFGRVAAETGYADQAHLSREVRALAGVPLRQLL